jgi:hypothetical protein
MNSELTPELVHMTLIAGLHDILMEVNGTEVTGDLVFMNFYRKGEKFGEKIGTGKDPQTVMKNSLNTSSSVLI